MEKKGVLGEHGRVSWLGNGDIPCVNSTWGHNLQEVLNDLLRSNSVLWICQPSSGRPQTKGDECIYLSLPNELSKRLVIVNEGWVELKDASQKQNVA